MNNKPTVFLTEGMFRTNEEIKLTHTASVPYQATKVLLKDTASESHTASEIVSQIQLYLQQFKR